jgi:hypothetical protein
LEKLINIPGIHDMRRLLNSKRRKPKGQDLVRHIQVLEFLRFQRYGLQKSFWKRTRKESASIVAATGGHGERVRNRIIQHEKDWIKNRHIPLSYQGKSPMLHRLIDDEGTKLALREYLASAGERITGQSVAYAISSYWQTGILPFEEQSELRDPPSRYAPDTEDKLAQLAQERQEVQDTLSRRTAVKWLQKMGYKLQDVRKGVYKDGHERVDVVEYRQEQFLPALKELENRMVRWELIESNGGEELRMVYPTNLPVGVKPIVLIVHDESTFNANDGRSKIWIKDDHIPLKKKSRGKGIMVSDFLTPGGRLQVPEGTNLILDSEYGIQPEGPKRLDSHRATCSIEYGGDTWWDGDQLVDQVLQLAIPIFEVAFPDCQALFLFDNATSHSAYTKDALRASAMNLRPGGGQAKLWPSINSLTREIQPMVMADGSPKGLQMVLEERGIWRPRLRVQCRRPDGKKNKLCLNGGSCCARALIANEPDFKAQRSRLEEEVELKGHLVCFFPKYHCELNFIEYYWGAAKRYARRRCGYTIRALRNMVPECLNSVKPTLIWKYWARTERMMRAYREGIAYGTPDFKEKVTKTYRSHRRVSDSETVVTN